LESCLPEIQQSHHPQNPKSKNQKTLEVIRLEKNKFSDQVEVNENLCHENRILKQKLQKLVHTKSEIQNLQEKLQKNLVECQAENEEYLGVIRLEKEASNELKSKISNLQTENKEFSSKIKNLEEEIIPEISKDKENLSKVVDDNKLTLSSQNQENSILQNEVTNLTNKFQSINYELDLSKARTSELENIIQKSQESSKKLQSNLPSQSGNFRRCS